MRLGYHPAGIAQGGREYVHVLLEDHVHLAPGKCYPSLLWRRGRLDTVEPELCHERIDELGVPGVLPSDSVYLGLLLPAPAVPFDTASDHGKQ